MSSTVYDVKVRYSLDDRTSRGLGGIASAADKASQKTFALRGALGALGAGAAFAAGKRFLIDYNNDIDKMRIGMSTIISMQFKKPFEQARMEADKLFSRFQELAKKSPSTTKDFIQMGNALAPVVAMLGGGTDKIEKLAQGALLAGLATGTQADVAANDVKAMLLGQVEKPDKMANQLLASRGMQAKDFNAMEAVERAQLVESILQDPALLRSADEFGKSFAGTVSTFQDQLEIALGQVGLPLMTALTAEVSKWNSWIEKHPRTIGKIVSEVGGMIKSSFEFARSAAGWLLEHRDTLLAVAKTFLVFKGASMATNIFSQFAQGASGLVEKLKTAGGTLAGVMSGTGAGGLAGAFRGLVGLLSGAGGVIPVFATLATAAYQLWRTFADINNDAESKGRRMEFTEALGMAGSSTTRLRELDKLFASKPGQASPADKMDTEVRQRLETERSKLRGQLADPAVMGPILRAVSDAREKHGFGGLGTMSDDTLSKVLGRGISSDEFGKLFADNPEAKQLVSELNDTYRAFGQMGAVERRRAFMSAFPEQFPDQTKSELPTQGDLSAWMPQAPSKADVKVTIHKIEVASEDPDRFVHGLVAVAEKGLKNPTQAASTIAGGF